MPFLGTPIAYRTMAPAFVEQKPEEILANFEELSVLETKFEDAEAEISRSSVEY